MNDQSPKLHLKHGPPLFEGFTLQMVAPGRQRKARSAVTRVLSKAWQVKAFGDSGTDFEVTSKTKKKNALSPGQAWDKTYRLRSEPGVVYAEPILTIPVSAPPEFQPEAVQVGVKVAAKPSARAPAHELRAATVVFGTKHLPESDDPAWSIKQVKVLEA